MPVTFEIRHTCESMHNTNPHEVFSNSHKKFTFVSHICSFMFMIPYIFLICQSYWFYCQKHFAAVHKYFTFWRHISPFTSITTHVSLFDRHISFSLFILITSEIIHTCISLHKVLMPKKC